MKTTRQKQIALFASLVIGAGSGPFLFRAAGIVDFPKNQISHYVIAACYGVGAMKMSMFILLKLLSALGNAPAEANKKSAGALDGGSSE